MHHMHAGAHENQNTRCPGTGAAGDYEPHECVPPELFFTNTKL